MFPRLSGREGSPGLDRDGREKGSKSLDRFEVWHHHVSLRQPGELALMLRLDERR